MFQVMSDLDRLLGASSGFLLGSWISDARAMAVAAGAPEDADFLEWNARSQGVSHSKRTNVISSIIRDHVSLPFTIYMCGGPTIESCPRADLCPPGSTCANETHKRVVHGVHLLVY
jgi:hypothetical protein